MKYILFIALFLSIDLEAQSLLEIVNQKETFLVDVRTPEEFTQGSVKNAVNIPLKDLENHIQQFRGKKNIVVFCRRGNRSAEAKKILQKFDIKNVFDGGAWQNVQNLVKTNILENISFTNKPNFYKVKENAAFKQVAVALGKNSVLTKHKTSTPVTLVVLKGEIDFVIDNQHVILKTYDTYEVPVDVEHEVVGLSKENLFLLTKEK